MKRTVRRACLPLRLLQLEDRLTPASFLVTTLADSGAGSLREAITAADTDSGSDNAQDDLITFQAGLTGTLTLVSALPTLADTTGSVTLTGPGAALVTVFRSAAGGTPDFRFLTINPGVSVAVSDLTWTNGRDTNPATDTSGILNAGTLDLTNVSLLGGVGVGIFNNGGTLTILGSTIASNSGSDGAGIFTAYSASLTMVNSTVSGNAALNDGGGIYNEATATMTLTNVTVTGNRADSDGAGGGEGGGILDSNTNANAVTLRNTIVAGNFQGTGTTAQDITLQGGAAIVAGSNNLVGDAGSAGGLTDGSSGNLVGVGGSGTRDTTTVLNTTLAANGGPTLTHILVAASPAINAGSNALLPGGVTTDQRGFARIVATTVDMGAVEFAAALPNQVPSFTKGPDVTALEDAAAFSAAWATNISPGAGEAGQTLTFNVSNNNNGLFAVQPTVAADGTLSFTPAANANGSATVTLTLQDNGGTANGGVDTSAAQTFVINLTAVNDRPAFTPGGDVTVLADSGAYSAAWATGLSAGPADEAGQTLTFNVSNNNGSPFSVQPALDPATGNLTFTVAAGATGSSTVTVALMDNGGTANGGQDSTTPLIFILTINAPSGGVNTAPSFTKGPDVTVLEDAATFSAAWATAISAGPPADAGQTLTFNISNNNTGLFAAQPAIDPATGNLTFTPATDANGSATVTVTLMDNGGTAGGGQDTSAAQTFVINLSSVNDAPSFTEGPDVSVAANSGAFLAAWATALSTGPANESGQTLAFQLSNNNAGLFAVAPAIDAAGNLSFTPAANATGSATVTVNLTDNGGTANGGIDAATVQTFVITITGSSGGVNAAPSFTKGPDVTVLEDAAAYSAAWATALSAGPPSEASQTLTFLVQATNPGLFAVAPAIDATGKLTFTLAPNANGASTVSVRLMDNGGTANGGQDTSAVQTFTIAVTPVNDRPTFTYNGPPPAANAGTPQTIANFLTNLSPGPANEAGQTLTITLQFTTESGTLTFSQPPQVNPLTGALTYTVAAGTFGVASGTLQIMDNGGSANGGTPFSVLLPFSIRATNPAAPVRFAVGPGPGAEATVRYYDAATGALLRAIVAYPGFTGGVRVAVGDVNGDGVPDIITGAGVGGGSHVKVFDGVNGGELASFYAYGAAFTGGVYVAAGDVTGDGKAEIITGAGPGGGPHIKVFSGLTAVEGASFYAYAADFTNGVRVGTVDLDGDGVSEIITGAGAGGGPHVKVFNATTTSELRSFFAYDPQYTGGVFVAGGDVNGDGKGDIITGIGPGGSAHVRVFSGVDGSSLASFYAYDPAFPNGVTVGAVDADHDGKADIITGAGPGAGPHVKLVNALQLSQVGANGVIADAALLQSIYGVEQTFLGGVNVG